MKFQIDTQLISPYRPQASNRAFGFRLDANENLWGPAPRVAAALRKLRPEHIAAYPDAGETTEAAVRRFGTTPERLILTNGADEAIYALMSLLTGPKDEILMPVPGFSIYPLTARIRGAVIRGIPLGSRFEFSRATLMKAISRRTRLVILVTPNNPTGTEIKQSDVKAIIAKSARFDVLVICDETYAGFSRRSHGEMVRHHPNLIVIGSFSKYFALAGLRLGYVIAAPEVIAGLRAILPPYSVNAAALAAGKAALESPSFYERIRREIVRERKNLSAALRREGLTVFPSAANFLCVRVEPEADRIRKRLASSGIFVKSFPEEPQLSDCLRITVSRPRENRRLAAALAETRRPEALLFDMDGVLVDVSASYRRAIEETVIHFSGERASPALVSRLKLRPDMNNDWDVVAAILAAKGRAVPRRKIIAAFQDFYLGGKGRPGLRRSERWLLPRSLLERLAGRYRLGIVTGRPERDARLALGRFETGRFFRAVIVHEDTRSRPKPDPFGLRLALHRLGVRRAIYFGDSTADMAAAKAAGVKAVAVPPPGLVNRAAWTRRMNKAGAERFAENLPAFLEEYL